MSTTAVQTEAPMRVMTDKDVVKLLQRFAMERRIAFLKYPSSFGVSEKLRAIDEILAMLFEAETKMPRGACAIVLKTALNFHFIAPRSRKEEFVQWVNKIENLFGGCRAYLGKQPQN